MLCCRDKIKSEKAFAMKAFSHLNCGGSVSFGLLSADATYKAICLLVGIVERRKSGARLILRFQRSFSPTK